MADDRTHSEKVLLTFDDSDMIVVPVKANAVEPDGALNPGEEKLAGSQNAQNYQKN